MEKRYFLILNKHIAVNSLQNKLRKIGFVEQADGIGYFYDNNRWKEIEPCDYYEGFFMFARDPIPEFNILWDMFIWSKNEDNRIGSISYILNKQPSNDFKVYVHNLKNQSLESKKIRKALDVLERICRL